MPLLSFHLLTLIALLNFTTAQLAISEDGNCGGTTSQTCLNSVFGDCCSSKGFCGGDSAYCGAGCQSAFGSCTSANSETISINGDCGATDPNRQICLGSEFGDCCSEKGFCGGTSDYCGTGCQSAFGTCSNSNGLASSSSSSIAQSTSSASSASSSSTTGTSRPAASAINTSSTTTAVAADAAAQTSTTANYSPTTTTTIAATTDENPTPMSTGAKAGVGVGIAGGVALIGALIFFILLRRRRGRSASARHGEAAELPGPQKDMSEHEYGSVSSPLSGSTMGPTRTGTMYSSGHTAASAGAGGGWDVKASELSSEPPRVEKEAGPVAVTSELPGDARWR